jgi:hypothetical protein
MWVVDDTLQLQRMACESSGRGMWRGQTASVPVTTEKDCKFRESKDVDENWLYLRRRALLNEPEARGEMGQK